MKKNNTNDSNAFGSVEPFNARIPKDFADALELVAAKSGLKKQEIAAVTIAFALGIKDANLEHIITQMRTILNWNLTPSQRGYFKILRDTMGKMERAKGFEPSTFTLARLGSHLKISVSTATADTRTKHTYAVSMAPGRKMPRLHSTRDGKIRARANSVPSASTSEPKQLQQSLLGDGQNHRRLH